MCKRVKQPYLGKFNLVGGKVKENEDDYNAAYRELFEESGITKDDITLTYIMDMHFKLDDLLLEVFAGKLNKEVQLVEEVNPLVWMSLDEDYTSDKFAGEGNIQYMLNYIEEYYKEILE